EHLGKGADFLSGAGERVEERVHPEHDCEQRNQATEPNHVFQPIRGVTWMCGCGTPRNETGAVRGTPRIRAAQCEGSGVSPCSRARTSDSRKRRCPPGVRMLLIRPEAAHRVTVLGSTRKREATSPGVSKRSVVLSTFTIPLHTRPGRGTGV